MLHALLNQRWFYAMLFTLGTTQLSAATGLDTARIEQLATGVKKILNEITEIRRIRPLPVTEFPGRIADKSAISSVPLEARGEGTGK